MNKKIMIFIRNLMIVCGILLTIPEFVLMFDISLEIIKDSFLGFQEINGSYVSMLVSRLFWFIGHIFELLYLRLEYRRFVFVSYELSGDPYTKFVVLLIVISVLLFDNGYINENLLLLFFVLYLSFWYFWFIVIKVCLVYCKGFFSKSVFLLFVVFFFFIL